MVAPFLSEIHDKHQNQESEICQYGLQVLTAVQRVLGAVRMQQQRDPSRVNGVQSDPPKHATSTSAQRVQEAERAERAAQQAVKALQKKESVWEAELGAAQTNNNQLNKRVRVEISCMDISCLIHSSTAFAVWSLILVAHIRNNQLNQAIA